MLNLPDMAKILGLQRRDTGYPGDYLIRLHEEHDGFFDLLIVRSHTQQLVDFCLPGGSKPCEQGDYAEIHDIHSFVSLQPTNVDLTAFPGVPSFFSG